PRAERDAIQLQCKRLVAGRERVDAFSIGWQLVLPVAPGLPAESGDLEFSVSIGNLSQFFCEPRPLLPPLVFRQLAQVEVFRSPPIIAGVTGFEERMDGALRRVAIQRILGGWSGSRLGAGGQRKHQK